MEPLNKIQTVLIIGGAGPAGIIAQQVLKRQGFKVIALQSEPESYIGGTWCSKKQKSILYQSLRTNLPVQLMTFSLFPWKKRYGDDRQYPNFKEIQAYLRDCAEGCEIKFNQKIIKLYKQKKENKQIWIAQSQDKNIYEGDAVIISTGLHNSPNYPNIPTENFAGKIYHSCQYKNPEPFKDQVVVIVGGFASAQDLSRDIAHTAKKVYIVCHRQAFSDLKTPFGYENRAHRIIGKDISKLQGKRVTLTDGTKIEEDIDCVIFATGYHLIFPFLDDNRPEKLRWDQDYVRPLYEQMVFLYDPTLCFMGLPKLNHPFPILEVQANWLAKFLKGQITLPSIEEMNTILEKEIATKGKGYNFHKLGFGMFKYYERLISASKCEPLFPQYKLFFIKNEVYRRTFGDTYRDIPIKKGQQIKKQDMEALKRGT